MAVVTRTLTLKSADGDQLFPIRDLDFTNLVCDLEGTGIDVMGLVEGNLDRAKIFTTMRGLIAVMIGVEPVEAGKLMSDHLSNGGTIEEVFEAFTKSMQDANFGKTPQDHKKPQTAVAKKGRKATEK